MEKSFLRDPYNNKIDTSKMTQDELLRLVWLYHNNGKVISCSPYDKKEERDKRFNASLQGVSLDDEPEGTKTFDDVKRKALGINATGDDVVSLQGSFAQEAGFGIGQGLGYSQE